MHQRSARAAETAADLTQDRVGIFSVQMFRDVIEEREIIAVLLYRKPQRRREAFQRDIPYPCQTLLGFAEHLSGDIQTDGPAAPVGRPFQQATAAEFRGSGR